PPYNRDVIASVLQAGKRKVLIATVCLIAAIALADWRVGNRASLGVFYILPMMLGGTVLSPVETALLALLCSSLRSAFDIFPTPPIEMLLRFFLAAIAYGCCGLFVIALMRNRRLAIEHLAKVRKEQGLRREAEEQLKILVESSPAAILTISADGAVIA